MLAMVYFFFSSRRRHTRYIGDWSSDVCSSVLKKDANAPMGSHLAHWRPFSLLLTVSWLTVSYLVSRIMQLPRSEERRVGKECRSRWSRYGWKKMRLMHRDSQSSARKKW